MKIRQRKRKARKRRKMEKSKIHNMGTDEENVRGKQEVKKGRESGTGQPRATSCETLHQKCFLPLRK